MHVGTTGGAKVRHGAEDARGKASLLPFWTAVIVLVPIGVLLAAAWASGSDAPVGLVDVAALTGLVAGIALPLGVLASARYAARREPKSLIAGCALASAGVVWVESLVLLAGGSGAPWQGAALWASWGAHLTLPAVVLGGSTLLPQGAPRPRHGAAIFLGVTVAVTVAAVSLPWWAPATPVASPELTIRHPLALWPALLGALALLAWLRRSDATESPLGQGIAVALYVSMLSHALLGSFVATAAGRFHAAEVAADLAAVLAAGAGLIVGTAREARLAVRNLERLGDEARQRERAERALALEAARLQRSNESLSEFAYVASHDLQEPLRMISSYLQLVERRYNDKLDDDGRTFIAFAVDGAVRMKHLISDLLVFSRVGTKGREPVLTPANDVLAATLKDLEVTIAEAGARVTADPLPTVWVDGRQLGQLLQNLIGNAIKFRRPDVPPHVHVTAERDDGGWRFSVRDNGIGIDAKYAERVFGIFQRLHGGSEYAGSGIGLAVARKIVDRHGGRIWIDTGVREGTSVVWTLPDLDAADAPEERNGPELDPELQAHVRSLIERAGEVL